MPTNLFFELNTDKQTKIIDVALSEFANYGYMNSSTNRIVKNSGISKGSLFKYFPNKEELYFFILDNVTSELISSLEKEVADLSSEIFQRIIDYSVLEFEWYIQHPKKSKFLINAFSKINNEIYQKIIVRYGVREQDIYYKLTDDIDISHFRWDRQKTIDILKWFLKGFNDDFVSQIQLGCDIEFDSMRNKYVKLLTEHMEILKIGLMK